MELIVGELIEYANEDQDNFKLYFNSTNRHDQFPYIMNVLVQDDAEQVKTLINV